MGKCPTCRANSFFGVSTRQCVWCGKIICNKCVPQPHGSLSFKTQLEIAPANPASYEVAGYCSDACFQQFWQRVKEFQMENEVGTDITGFNGKVVFLWNQSILNSVAKDYISKAKIAIHIHSQRFAAFPWCDSSGKPLWMFDAFSYKAKLTLAQNLERCGRTQDAAKVFEELHMYDKSRELRESDRHIIIKKTNVSVNLNALLQQVKEGGIVAIFRCPHCGGKLKISDKTTATSLRICEHCNSEIEAMDLADFLKAALT